MVAMTSQNCLFNSLYRIYQRKHQGSALLAFGEDSPNKGPVMRKAFPSFYITINGINIANFWQLTTMQNLFKAPVTKFMMTSSNGNIFHVTGPLCGEFTGHRWFPSQRRVTRSFDVFFNLFLNKRLSKQSWGWWFETSSHPLWRHCIVSILGIHSNLDILWKTCSANLQCRYSFVHSIWMAFI